MPQVGKAANSALRKSAFCCPLRFIEVPSILASRGREEQARQILEFDGVRPLLRREGDQRAQPVFRIYVRPLDELERGRLQVAVRSDLIQVLAEGVTYQYRQFIPARESGHQLQPPPPLLFVVPRDLPRGA